MIGGVILAGLALASTPDRPGGATTAKPPAKTLPAIMPSAVALGAKWGIVTSVHRTPLRNRAVGGAPNSFHLLGRAIDIARRPGVRHADIDAAYRRAGYRLVESLDEGDHSHFAFDLPGAAPLPAPDLRATPIFTVAAPACPVDDPAARRRPDRAVGCLNEPELTPRLRPLTEAP